ncbi:MULTISPECIES: EexN family lipoprotein [unclassified Bradyrhizobium]|uniref:EexN family lipoprotein n=1 Tax=unclassified Bradyrhizobium TaxID=2631580 RepID=UPI001BA8CBD5|nr:MULTISPECIES: EexN family lipoprotein [unclassified Bradyrhizobium]MBR1208738.1 EexN family lipoprotein [Bradyrhizobium sp. AUGA SZCCT0124]MBR1316931.1 EexN family lipoprotein [Bradyrhizobium sp. AUGA SZCCT0051]MBR1345273.1 EexN family lipoprotein [Bradyrhizobium sp. AUGA SZCCT0105]MBR1360025.1 EexN family lipoprotein [Bradyrhizobium sp. AUGA SZCCT0045]
MKTRLAIVFLTVAAAALTGCNDANEGQQVKTVGWFLDHRDELAATLKGCGDNPGEFEKTPNCINANEARNQVTVHEMEDALK